MLSRPPIFRFNQIVLLGEAPGADEERKGEPFVGASGKELRKMCKEAGIDFDCCYLANVFSWRPEANKIENFCVKGRPKDYPLTFLRPGFYVMPELLSELDRLREELDRLQPNLVIALGNTPLWAMCQLAGITKVRGTVMYSTLRQGQKVIPTFHPAGILRNWSNRVVAVGDLTKAAREAAFPEIRRISRTIMIPETPDELSALDLSPGILSVDIETDMSLHQIKCIGFASSPHHALVVPFINSLAPGSHYWSEPDEIKVWRWVKYILESPIKKLGQNFSFDLQYLFRMGIKVNNYCEDTMLLHHALYPELSKGLDFLGAGYTDEIAWKTMRPRGAKTEKREE